jgi:hypothetical protein
MKKFGTPMGAAPGNANEKVGLAGVGTPLLVRSGPDERGFDGLLGALGAFGALGLEPTEPREDLWWEGFCALPGPVGAGGACPDEEDEDEDDDDDEEEDELVDEELLLDELVIVTGGGTLVVEVVVVLGEAAHETATSVVPAGIGTWEAEGAVTVIVSICPVSSTFTVTVQTSADAVGSAATDIMARRLPAVMVNTLSFRLLNTLG